MQKNNFENNIQESFADFQLQPTDGVWKLIEQKLAEKRRRRIAFFWMFVGLLLISGGTLFILSNKNTANTSTTAVPKTMAGEAVVANSNPQSPYTVKRDEEVLKNSKSGVVTQQQSDVVIKSTGSSATLTNDNGTDTKKALPNKMSTTGGLNTLAVQNISEAHNSLLLTQSLSNTNKHTIDSAAKTAVAGTANGLVSVQKVDTLSTAITDKAKPVTPAKSAIKDSSVTAVQSKQKAKKFTLGTTVNIGLSNNIEELNLFSKAESYNPMYNSVGSSIGSFNNAQRSAPKSNLGFGAGLFANYNFKKRVAVSFGLQYQYYSYTLSTGAKVNTPRVFFDSAALTSTTVPEYYRAGSQNKFVNRFHFVEVPVNLLVQLNRNQSKPVNVSLGVSPGFLLYSRALYYNSGAKAYYQDNQQLNKLQLAAQAGITFPVINGNKYQLLIGPAFQYNFSNLTRSFTGSQEHLVYPSIKANILFKK